jgi:hypothetical protein
MEKKIMVRPLNTIDVYLEIGKKRTFAGAIDWPGWCRSGRNEQAALQALLDYGSRYAQVLRLGRLSFSVPTQAASLVVRERFEGTTTTDFGAPDVAPSNDTRPVDDAELRRFQTLLKACWRKFDAAVQVASGKVLRKGPRGGGRELEEIVEHVAGADAAYLARLGWKLSPSDVNDLQQTRVVILDALGWAVSGERPERGPRGGKRWELRYFVRRVAWHILDHAWEIEDRVSAS